MTLLNDLPKMIQEEIITYKEENKRGIIDLIFATQLLSAERMQICNIQAAFNHDSDHLPILFS